jgi:two-component system response regulator AtoC
MANILVVDDEYPILETIEMFMAEKGHKVYTAETAAKAYSIFERCAPEVVILDIRLPDEDGLDLLKRMHEANDSTKIIMITAFHDMETTIEAMKRGAYDYIHKPLDADEIDKAVKGALFLVDADRKIPSQPKMIKNPGSRVIIGKSRPMREIFKLIGLLCQNRTTALIQGETGTGKELIARVIHKNSLFCDEPMIILDCSAVVENLLESELFGHQKGAFTGADHDKPGKIEMAGAGTLFLDEIGELSLNLQGKFLGFLERLEYMPVGGQDTLKSRCRIIAATNRDLVEMVQTKRFRKDLYYRLKVMTLQVPPLRERLSDIPDLVDHFLQKTNLELGTSVLKLQEGILNRLKAHPWVGNVRELENVIVAAIVRSRGKVILMETIEDILVTHQSFQEDEISSYSLANMEKRHIHKTLDGVGWNRTQAARLLKISLPTLRSKIKKYGIDAKKKVSFTS